MRRSPIQNVSLLIGFVFALVGIAGFIPGITQDLNKLDFAGHNSHAMLLGLFMVSILHNLVHLLFGLWGGLAARTAGAAKTFLIGGGFVYLILWLYGLVVDQNSDANFVPMNGNDNWLHLVLGVAMIILGFVFARTSLSTTRDTTDGTASTPVV